MKKTSKTAPSYEPPVDYGSPNRANHDQVRIVDERDDEGRPVRHARVDNFPLDVYFTKSLLTPEQHTAGCRLYRDWRASGFQGKITADYIGVTCQSPTQWTDRMADARAAYKHAMTSISPILQSVAHAVCIEGYSARAWAIAQRRSARDGFRRLKDALDIIAKAYHDHDNGRSGPTRKTSLTFCTSMT